MDWYLQLHRPDASAEKCRWLVQEGDQSLSVDSLRIDVSAHLVGESLRLSAIVSSDAQDDVFLSLDSVGSETSRLWSFDGPVNSTEIYRQSPHDVDAWVVRGIARQSVPLVAIHKGGCFHIALNGSAAFYGNACSQFFDPASHSVSLRSGDDGGAPGLSPSPEDVADFAGLGSKDQRFAPGRIIEKYHRIDSQNPHRFEAVIFAAHGQSLEHLRSAAYQKIDEVFNECPNHGAFGRLSFATAWMNLRVNDSGKSRYWVVPAAEYSNIQYNRDAFWIAMMLDPEMDRQCLLNELAEVDPQAEYPLFTMIWSRRVTERTGALDRNQLQACLDTILRKVKSNWYLAFDTKDGRHDFQYWQDSMAYAADDSIAYNQGLLAVALRVAEGHGLDLGGASAELAAQNYRRLYDSERGFLSVSRLKTSLMSPDSLVPDLLAQVCFGEPLLAREVVEAHIATLNRLALTPYGYKVLCRNDGDYPSDGDTTIKGYTSESQRAGIGPGDYQRGGSWFLYDCLCLLDGVLHEVPTAAQLLVWRIRLEMDAYGTTYEYIHTKTGQPHKSNMGWNVAIYAFLRQLTAEERICPQILQQIEATAS